MPDSLFNYIFKKCKNKSIQLHILLLVLAIIYIWYFLPEIKYTIPKVYKTDLWIRIIASTFLIILFIIIDVVIPVLRRFNRTKKIGVGIIITESYIEEMSTRKEHFFKKLKTTTSEDLNIIIYEHTKFNSKEEEIDFLKKHNLAMSLNIEDFDSKKDGKKCYEFRIKGGSVEIESNGTFINRVCSALIEELENTFNEYIDIYEENEIDDINKNANYLSSALNYIISIILMISNKGEKAIELLEKVKTIDANSKDKNTRHILKSIPLRILEANFIIINNYMYDSDYYCNKKTLFELEKRMGFFKEKNEELFKRFQIPKKTYEYNRMFINNVKSIILYEKNRIDDAIEIQEFYLKHKGEYGIGFDESLTAQLNLGFLYAVKGNYEKSLELYKKANNRKDINSETSRIAIESVLLFINKRLDYQKDNKGIAFSYAILNYYFRDKLLATKMLNDLSKEKNIKEFLSRIWKFEKIYTKSSYS